MLARWGALAGVALLLSSCGGGGATNDSASASPTPQLTRAEAQEALDRSLELLIDRKTGSFEHIATLGTSGQAVTTTQGGSFDLSRKYWQASLTAQSPGEAPVGPLQFIGTAEGLYLTSPEWPAKIRGRWLRYSSTDVESVAGPAAQVDLSDGQPIATSVLFLLKATSATSSPEGITVTAELPSSEAVVLAHLKSGLIKNNVDHATINGVTDVTLELAPDGAVRRLQLSRTL